MGIHKRHIPGEIDAKVRFERGPDGKLRVDQFRSPSHPETIAEERPPEPADPRPVVPPNVGPV